MIPIPRHFQDHFLSCLFACVMDMCCLAAEREDWRSRTQRLSKAVKEKHHVSLSRQTNTQQLKAVCGFVEFC